MVGRTVLPSADTKPLGFGKYKGRTPDDIARYDPGYIVWMYETFVNRPAPVSEELYQLCKEQILITEEEDYWSDDSIYMDGHF